ncbi:tetratricopeptide repeat protein [Lentzea sp. NPDC051838]|uniref:ATP-binding protein n=1 Tax=Lentzea sp. NPDC051838 TaxID=3154849 RepID=UPI0034409D94
MENTPSSAVVRASWQGLPSVPSGGVPRQLPAVVSTFSGRLDELAQLDSALTSGAVVITAVNGTAGVGKTALALHWAHLVADQFPDGQLYVNMRGFEPDREPMPVEEAVRGFLDAFGVPSDAIPVSLDAQTALFRSKIAGRRVLLVLDNVNNAAQVRPLLPGGSTCFALITSRNSLAGLVAEHGARPLRLDLLSDDEAAALLRARLGDVDTDELVELCAGLPLALAIVASQPNTSIAELRDERLEALDLGEEHVSVRSVFSWSLRALSEPAARLFRLLGLHPGPDVDARAAAALAGQPDCRKALRELVRASLLDEYLPGRFRFHDLLRLYARELAGTDDEAQRRMFDFYLHTAWAADRAFVTYRIGIDLPPLDPDVVPLTFAGPNDALDWFAAERAVLTGLVGRAASAGFDVHAWQLALSTRSYVHQQGRWRDGLAVYRAAIDPVNRACDPLAQARVHRGLGRILCQLSEFDEAESLLWSALHFATSVDDNAQCTRCQEALSTLYAMQERHEHALQHAEVAMLMHSSDDDGPWRASLYVMMGRCLAALTAYDAAFSTTTKALCLLSELAPRDEFGESEALTSASHILAQMGEFKLSLEYAQHALVLHRRLHNRPGIVQALYHIGDAHGALGRPDEARLAKDEARAILAELQE